MVVLDTAAVLYWTLDPERLPERASAAISSVVALAQRMGAVWSQIGNGVEVTSARGCLTGSEPSCAYTRMLVSIRTRAAICTQSFIV